MIFKATKQPVANRGVTCIYSLSDPRTNQVRYIGKANDLKVRLSAHLSRPCSLRMKNWLAELAGAKPIVGIVERCPLAEWKKRESFWIGYFRSDPLADLLNICDGGDGLTAHTEAVRTRISEAQSGVKRRAGTGARISAALLGKTKRPHTEEEKRNVSLKMRGRRKSPEHRLAVIAAITGKKRSPESCARMSEAAKLRMTPDVRAKISASLIGKKLPKHVCELIRQKALARGKFTPEHCAAISLSAKNRGKK